MITEMFLSEVSLRHCLNLSPPSALRDLPFNPHPLQKGFLGTEGFPSRPLTFQGPGLRALSALVQSQDFKALVPPPALLSLTVGSTSGCRLASGRHAPPWRQPTTPCLPTAFHAQHPSGTWPPLSHSPSSLSNLPPLFLRSMTGRTPASHSTIEAASCSPEPRRTSPVSPFPI